MVDARAEDLRTVKLAEDDTSAPDVDVDVDASEPAGIESALALERARHRFAGREPEPVMVGRYRIVERLGEGGMGIVYAAHDDELDRMVAVKVLRADLARDDGNRRRLLREAQAMARLSHPNVGHVYEVGRHGGHVFIAMERVVGSTLRAWCRQRTWREIVRMHASAGDGLAAAHTAGLVHRDYKCENVLVGEDDRPRVLDFGLARSDVDASTSSEGAPTVQSGDGNSEITRAGTIVGTPAYMAPEQLAGETVDARADQFSFCVALFECLYGERPFRGTTMAELRTRHQTRPLAVDPRTHGVPAGVHAVIVRGLALDPDRRHASMPELLAELRTFLRDPSRVRWLVAAGIGTATITGAILLGQAALHRRAEGECAREGAEIETVWGDASRKAVHAGLLATGVAHASTTADKVVPLLDQNADAWRQARTEACIAADVEHTRDPGLAAAASWCLDERRLELEALVAELSRADANAVEKAVEAAASLSSIDPCTHEGLLRSLPTPPADRVAELEAVRAQLQRAEALERAGRHAEGLDVTTPVLADANTLAWPPLVAAALLQHGTLLHEQGRYDEAERVLENAYFEATRAGAVEVEAEAASQLVTTVGVKLARHADGRRWSRHADAAIAGLGDEQPLRTADNLGNLALVLINAGEYTEAKALQEQALAIWERELGPDHLFVASGLDNLGLSHDEIGDYPQAKALYQRALAIQERALGPEHPDVASTLANIATVLYEMGETDEAKPMHEQALAIRERALGPDHPLVALSLNNLATLHQAIGKHAEARVLHERALRIRENALGSDHPDVAQSLFNLAGVHFRSGEIDDAQRLFEQAQAVNEKVFGADHPNVARGHDSLGAVYWAKGDYPRAQASFERALATFEATLGPDHIEVATSLSNLAAVFWAQRVFPSARVSYERALPIFERVYGADHPELADLLHGLGEVYLAEDRPVDAADFAERALAIRERSDDEPLALAGGRLLVARASWEADRDRSRARELALQARDAYRAAGEAKADEIEVWLARH